MRINTNLISLNAKNQLKKNNKSTSSIMEKLSSGKRINKAADDAVGLAISQKMRAQIRGLDQANKNVQDGIFLIQTAEGALNEMENMAQRMRELSVQGANDTLTTEDREKIQKELNQLKEEIDVIANTTGFNTRKLLNGNMDREMKSVSKSVDLNILQDGSKVSKDLNIEGETIELNFTDDLVGSTEVSIANNGKSLKNEVLEKNSDEIEYIWSNVFGGSEDDYSGINCFKETSDNGYIMAVNSLSDDGDFTINKGKTDIWIMKLDNKGDLQWKKSYGGNDYDSIESINEISDGYIISGSSYSNDGDFLGNNGAKDGWVMKLDNTGDIAWKEIIGGSKSDYYNDIIEMENGDFIAVGNTESIDGDIDPLDRIGDNTDSDAFITKFSSDGNVMWKKYFGTTGYDFADKIIKKETGKYIIGGQTPSYDPTYINNNGLDNNWLLEIDSDGNIIDEKDYGDTEFDFLNNFKKTNDGGYLLFSETYNYFAEPENDNGNSDGWIIKLDENKDKEWEYIFGDETDDFPIN